ncbi:MAG: hypothetical protein NTV51_17060, partial [Verrucomicrobia bacterium]|nr:hypothetical protein [Verrucomicrobiota bacterium]
MSSATPSRSQNSGMAVDCASARRASASADARGEPFRRDPRRPGLALRGQPGPSHGHARHGRHREAERGNLEMKVHEQVQGKRQQAHRERRRKPRRFEPVALARGRRRSGAAAAPHGDHPAGPETQPEAHGAMVAPRIQIVV